MWDAALSSSRTAAPIKPNNGKKAIIISDAMDKAMFIEAERKLLEIRSNQDNKKLEEEMLL